MNPSPTVFSTQQVVSYGILRMPLSLVELPLFMFLPILYGGAGMSLKVIGFVLFATRALDAVADPLIGSWIAKHRARRGYLPFIWWGAPVLALGFVVLLTPRPDHFPLLASLILGSVLTFAAYSTVSIAYQAWAADTGTDQVQTARLISSREVFGLVGIVLASSLLKVESLIYLLSLFIGLLALGCVALYWAPKLQFNHRNTASAGATESKSLLRRLAELNEDWRFKRLMLVFLISGIASAIPATLVLFFIRHVLVAQEAEVWLLMAYFLAAAVGLPVWLKLCKQVGLETSWLIGMVMSVMAFAWAVGLGPGDKYQFLVICILTGLALGADLVVPSTLVSETIKAKGKSQSAEASYFGVYSFAIKFNLALAAAISLQLVEWGGFRPDDPNSGKLALSLVYAALPCALKLLAGVLLWVRPILRV